MHSMTTSSLNWTVDDSSEQKNDIYLCEIIIYKISILPLYIFCAICINDTSKWRTKKKVEEGKNCKKSSHVCHTWYKVNVYSWYLQAMCGFFTKMRNLLTSHRVWTALRHFTIFGGKRSDMRATEVFEHNHYDFFYPPFNFRSILTLGCGYSVSCEWILQIFVRKNIFCDIRDAEAKMHHLSDGIFSFHTFPLISFCGATIEPNSDMGGVRFMMLMMSTRTWTRCEEVGRRTEGCKKDVEKMRKIISRKFNYNRRFDACIIIKFSLIQVLP